MDKANAAPKDGDDAKDYIAFCNGEVGMMPAPGWKPGQIINEKDGCPDMEDNIGVFALPGLTAGTTAPVVPRRLQPRHPRQEREPGSAYDLLKILVSARGSSSSSPSRPIPALKSQLDAVSGSDAAIAQAKAAENSRFVPTSENWAGVEAPTCCPTCWSRSPRAATSTEAERRPTRPSKTTQQLNTREGSAWPPRTMTPPSGRHPSRRHDGGLAGAPSAGPGAALPADPAGHRRPRAAMLGYPLVRLVTLSLQEFGLPPAVRAPGPLGRAGQLPPILTDAYFWTVLWRTLIFCAVNVALTMVLGVLIALLLERAGQGMRLLVLGVADLGLGDAGADRHRRVAVDVRHRSTAS